MRYLPEDNLNYPVLVEIAGGNGSGFYLNYESKNAYLVTAYHVLFDPETKKIRGNSVTLTSYDKADRMKDLIFEVDLTTAKIFSDPARDTVMILLSDLDAGNGGNTIKWKPWVKIIKQDGSATLVFVNFLNLKKFADILESNEVFVLGYPNSLGLPGQIEKRRPLLRKGIIGGKNYINKTIILDCPVYFGNSGGLVIEVEDLPQGQRKFTVLGIVTQYVPFIEQLRSLQMGYTNVNMENSGYSIAIPADVIEEIIKANI